MFVYWLFMLAMTMLLPMIMLVFGRRFEKQPPKKINAFFGYRTTLSMKNQETWAYAHQCCGKYWFRVGWWVLLFSAIAMLLVLGRDIDVVSVTGVVVISIQFIPFLITLPVTERALHRSFDSSGGRIEKK